MLKCQRTNQKIVFPAGIFITGNFGKTTWRNRRHPVRNRLLHTFLARLVCDGSTIIIYTVGDHRPTIIPALLYLVQFISSSRTVLVIPKGLRFLVIDQSLRITMSI